MEKPAQHLLQNEEQAWKPIFNNVVVEEELLVDFIEENMRNLEMEILLKSENPSNLKFNSLLNEKFKYCFSSLPEEDTSNWSLLSLFHLLKENCTNLFKYPAQFCSNSFEIRSTLKLPPLLPLFLFLVSPSSSLPFLFLFCCFLGIQLGSRSRSSLTSMRKTVNYSNLCAFLPHLMIQVFLFPLFLWKVI